MLVISASIPVSGFGTFHVSVFDDTNHMGYFAQNIPVEIGEYQDNLDFVSTKLRYDLVLGMPWFEKYQPYIDWANRQVHFIKDGSPMTIHCTTDTIDSTTSVNLIHSNQTRSIGTRSNTQETPELILEPQMLDTMSAKQFSRFLKKNKDSTEIFMLLVNTDTLNPGTIISNNKVNVDPARIKAIADWPLPKTLHDLRSYLGLCNTISRHVKNLAEVLAPLFQLLKGHTDRKSKVEIQWNKELQDHFYSSRYIHKNF
jgi:hypothetical protein